MARRSGWGYRWTEIVKIRAYIVEPGTVCWGPSIDFMSSRVVDVCVIGRLANWVSRARLAGGCSGPREGESGPRGRSVGGETPSGGEGALKGRKEASDGPEQATHGSALSVPTG